MQGVGGIREQGFRPVGIAAGKNVVSLGVGSIFAFFEPLAGVHHVSVREHRTALDWAEEIRYLVDVMYTDARK